MKWIDSSRIWKNDWPDEDHIRIKIIMNDDFQEQQQRPTNDDRSECTTDQVFDEGIGN